MKLCFKLIPSSFISRGDAKKNYTCTGKFVISIVFWNSSYNGSVYNLYSFPFSLRKLTEDIEENDDLH